MIHNVFVLSDFGTRDTYSGQMKAALIRDLCGEVCIVDLSEGVPPGDIRAGAFDLMVSMPALPPGCGVLAVVDPGVGTSRRIVLADCSGRTVACPDNGLLSWVDVDGAWELPAPEKSSSTFQGRDCLAPALARALLDGSWKETLPPVDPSTLVRMPRGRPTAGEGFLDVPVAHVDGFGNCILWLTWDDLDGRRPLSIRNPRGSSFNLSPAETYGPARPGLLLLEGSCGLLEIALSGGSAAFFTGLAEGDTVIMSFTK